MEKPGTIESSKLVLFGLAFSSPANVKYDLLHYSAIEN